MSAVSRPLTFVVVSPAIADVELIVKAIIKVNHTGQIGDGRIFVSPVDNVVRVRTSEEGDQAIA